MTPPERLLVVEDELLNLELVQFLLEERGHEVIAVADVDRAREVLATDVPDGLLLDIHIPEEEGLSLVRELRAEPRTAGLPIIALTAHAMRGDRERFLAAGCDHYMAKPIDTLSFVDEVQRACRRTATRGPI